VVNILDFSLLCEFLREFCVPNFIHLQPIGRVNTLNEIVDHSLTGLSNVAEFWANHMYLKPDAVYRLLDTQIVTYLNSQESKIVSRYNFTATRWLDLPCCVMLPENSRDPILNNSTTETNDNVTTRTKKRQFSSTQDQDISTDILTANTIYKHTSTAPLLSKPEVVSYNMLLTMFLDGNKRIERMAVEFVV
jgi:hypothetical protein